MKNNFYCVYLTVYRGNKLPPFYIGSTNISKIEKGYNGSVESKNFGEAWSQERKLNPHLFVTRILTYHDTREEAYKREWKFHKALDVNKSSMYINTSLAKPTDRFGGGFAGKKHTKSHKDYMREKYKNRSVPWLDGKKRPHHAKAMSGENNPMAGLKGPEHPAHGNIKPKCCCVMCHKETSPASLITSYRPHRCFSNVSPKQIPT